MEQNSATGLMSLSVELRLKIFRYLLSPCGYLYPFYSPRNRQIPRPEMSIFATCHQLRLEAQDSLPRVNTYVVSLSLSQYSNNPKLTPATPWLGSLSSLRRIRTLDLALTFQLMRLWDENYDFTFLRQMSSLSSVKISLLAIPPTVPDIDALRDLQPHAVRLIVVNLPMKAKITFTIKDEEPWPDWPEGFGYVKRARNAVDTAASKVALLLVIRGLSELLESRDEARLAVNKRRRVIRFSPVVRVYGGRRVALVHVWDRQDV